VNPQAPVVHVVAAFVTAGQACAQEPQLAGSVCSFTQKPLHSEKPVLQENEHAWLVHTALALTTPVVQVLHAPPFPQAVGVVPVEQTPDAQQPLPQDVPQAPQLFESVFSSTHAPLQLVKPVLHATTHALFEQDAVALATVVVQAVPQPPQWLESLVVSAHALPHSVGVALGQPEAQAEATQTGVPASALHWVVQPPQWFASFVRLTHVPEQFV
jgi:hypothetical protein